MAFAQSVQQGAVLIGQRRLQRPARPRQQALERLDADAQNLRRFDIGVIAQSAKLKRGGLARRQSVDRRAHARLAVLSRQKGVDRRAGVGALRQGVIQQGLAALS